MTTETHDPTTCPICPEKVGQGWRINDVTHCRGCGATWRAESKTNHCTRCHLTFNSLKGGYDLHTDFRHAHPSTVGLVARENRWGTLEWGTQEGFDQRDAAAVRLHGDAVGGHSVE